MESIGDLMIPAAAWMDADNFSYALTGHIYRLLC
jgi:hypothetical protein